MKAIHWSAAVLSLLLVSCSMEQAPEAKADMQAILHQMHATWDRPEAKLEAGPVVIEGDYAIADWTQGAMGGRALLKREHGEWNTVLCAGDGIRDAEGLLAVGLPDEQAAALAAGLAEAEKQVSPQRLALMAAFSGIVRMPAAGVGHDPHPASSH